MFVKSGKNAFWVKYPACLMSDKLVESAVKYFLAK